MQRLLSTLIVFSMIVTATVSAEATPRTRTEYVVTETNPFTNGVQSTQRFTDRDAANRQYAIVSRAHWVQWRFIGINEPLRFRRFNSSASAQIFINDDGPSKSGKLGIAILTNETRTVATRAKITPVTVPVTGSGNGGSGGRTDVGEVIGTIIGIIDR